MLVFLFFFGGRRRRGWVGLRVLGLGVPLEGFMVWGFRVFWGKIRLSKGLFNFSRGTKVGARSERSGAGRQVKVCCVCGCTCGVTVEP